MSAVTHLKLLINLARIDGDVDQTELTYIKNIAKANHVPENEFEQLVGQSHNILIPTDLTEDQRFEYLFSLVQLMKIDERLFENEIKYCSQIAYKMGYDQGVMFDLLLKVKKVSMEKNEFDELRKSTLKHLRES
jgi:uncharacterized tellurite resistance protein B-like protein